MMTFMKHCFFSPRRLFRSQVLRLPSVSCRAYHGCDKAVYRYGVPQTSVVVKYQPARTFLSALSATGFNDYEIERKTFKLDVPEYFNFVSDVLDKWAEKEQNGNKGNKNPAFWWIDDHGNELKWTFTDLQQKSKRVSNVIDKHCGVVQGDSVMVILPRVPEWWLLNIACLRTGTYLIPGTTQLTALDIKYRLQASKTTCIITDEKTTELVDQVISECTNVRCKLLVSQTGDSRPGWLDYQKLYQQAASEHQCLKTRSDEPMTMFFTSGTTGKPKMAQHTHASYGLGHVITGKYWLDLTPTDVHWNISDPGWAKSAYSNFFAPWTQGACVFIHDTPKFDPLLTLEVLQKYPISTLCAPATVFRMMVLHDLKMYKLKSLRHVVSGGEPLNPEVIDAWKAGTGGFICEGYGQTETVLLTGMFKCLKPRPGSMGKPAPGYEVHIVDDEGNRLPPGEEGNIGVLVKPHRPVGLFTHYVDDPERTAKSFKGDYYLTGDRAMCDDDGYLWFVGRDDDIINSAGYRIGPFEVESALIEHPAVAESAVVSSPDPTRGEVPKAFIVLTEDYKSKDKKQLGIEIQEYVKGITAPYKYPRKIEFVADLPKSVSGKIQRVLLRNKEWNR